MSEFFTQGLLCDLSIVIIVGVFDGIHRLFIRSEEIERYEDLTRRGYIVRK